MGTFTLRYLNVKLSLPPARQQVEGLLGSAPNSDPSDDLHLSTGEILPSQVTFKQLYQDYGHSWRITQAESLFDYAPGTNTDTFTDRNYPTQKITSASLEPAQRAAAQQICQGQGISDPVLLEACVLDVGVTEDPSFAEGLDEIPAPTKALETLQIQAQKVIYAPYEDIVVEYFGFPGNSNDWISVVSAGTPDSSYSQWTYLQGSRDGTYTFNGLPAGEYEVRGYFDWPEGGYTVQVRSSFIVQS